MPWNADGKRWDCEVCNATVERAGPWCSLYYRERRGLCRPLAKVHLRKADAEGDGAYVNALCAMGRAKWGEDMDW